MFGCCNERTMGGLKDMKKMDSRLGTAVASLDVPAVSDFEEDDPMEIIKTGDWVKVDGNTGIVEITRKESED